MGNTGKLAGILLLCVIVTGVLHFTIAPKSEKSFSDWAELDDFLLRQVQNFGYPAERVRIRTIPVNENFSRMQITVDIPRRYPQTTFHKQLSDSLKFYDARTFGVVQFPENTITIHVMISETVVRSIRFQYSSQ